MNCKIKINNKNSGLSILEALVSTAIVGIGFIAILQMTNFSVQSIDNSGERTKVNFMTTMIVEDVIGNRNTFYGKKAEDMKAPTTANPKFSEHLANNDWTAGECVDSSDGTVDPAKEEAKKDIYKEQKDNAPQNKVNKWEAVFTKGRFLKCKNNTETKKLKVFKMCRWDGCEVQNDDIFDEPMYIGRLEVKINSGNIIRNADGTAKTDATGNVLRKSKRKFVYFQSDYKIKN